MNNNNNNYLFVLEISKGNICTAIFFTFTQEFKIILSFIFLRSKETNNMKYTLCTFLHSKEKIKMENMHSNSGWTIMRKGQNKTYLKKKNNLKSKTINQIFKGHVC